MEIQSLLVEQFHACIPWKSSRMTHIFNDIDLSNFLILRNPCNHMTHFDCNFGLAMNFWAARVETGAEDGVAFSAELEKGFLLVIWGPVLLRLTRADQTLFLVLF